MNTYLQAASILTFFGGGLSFLMALSQLMQTSRTRYNYLLFFFLFSSAWCLMGIGLVACDYPLTHPWTMFFFPTAIFAVGPLGFLYYHSLLKPRSPLNYLLLHLAPAVLIFIGEITVFAFSEGYRLLNLQSLIFDPRHHPLTILIVAGILHVMCYFAYLLKVSLPLWGVAEASTEVRIVITIEFAAIVVGLLVLTGFLNVKKYLLVTGGMIDSLIHIAFFLASARYSQFFTVLGNEIRKTRYQKSLLKGLDTDEVYNRLMELMMLERIYRDPGLTIAELADKLLITPQQLSQFLNEKLNQNFRNFINAYRIEEAKTLLLTEPSRSILSISLEVGFNSKSVFNQAFKKLTGMSPSEYRANYGQQG